VSQGRSTGAEGLRRAREWDSGWQSVQRGGRA
jgi:hypothetical protein